MLSGKPAVTPSSGKCNREPLSYDIRYYAFLLPKTSSIYKHYGTQEKQDSPFLTLESELHCLINLCDAGHYVASYLFDYILVELLYDRKSGSRVHRKCIQELCSMIYEEQKRFSPKRRTFILPYVAIVQSPAGYQGVYFAHIKNMTLSQLLLMSQEDVTHVVTCDQLVAVYSSSNMAERMAVLQNHWQKRRTVYYNHQQGLPEILPKTNQRLAEPVYLRTDFLKTAFQEEECTTPAKSNPSSIKKQSSPQVRTDRPNALLSPTMIREKDSQQKSSQRGKRKKEEKNKSSSLMKNVSSRLSGSELSNMETLSEALKASSIEAESRAKQTLPPALIGDSENPKSDFVKSWLDSVHADPEYVLPIRPGFSSDKEYSSLKREPPPQEEQEESREPQEEIQEDVQVVNGPQEAQRSAPNFSHYLAESNYQGQFLVTNSFQNSTEDFSLYDKLMQSSWTEDNFALRPHWSQWVAPNVRCEDCQSSCTTWYDAGCEGDFTSMDDNDSSTTWDSYHTITPSEFPWHDSVDFVNKQDNVKQPSSPGGNVTSVTKAGCIRNSSANAIIRRFRRQAGYQVLPCTRNPMRFVADAVLKDALLDEYLDIINEIYWRTGKQHCLLMHYLELCLQDVVEAILYCTAEAHHQAASNSKEAVCDIVRSLFQYDIVFWMCFDCRKDCKKWIMKRNHVQVLSNNSSLKDKATSDTPAENNHNSRAPKKSRNTSGTSEEARVVFATPVEFAVATPIDSPTVHRAAVVVVAPPMRVEHLPRAQPLQPVTVYHSEVLRLSNAKPDNSGDQKH